MTTANLLDQSAHPDDAAIAQKTADSLRLRIRGYSYRRIAEELGIGKTLAHKYVVQALVEIREQNSESAHELRTLELERLDVMQAKLSPLGDADALDARTADTILRIMERRAKLIGLDAPIDARFGGLPGGAPISLSHDVDLTKLSIAELHEMERMLTVATPAAPPSPETTNG